MRNAPLVSAGPLCLFAAPAPARNDTATTQTPPAPDAQSFTPQPGVGVPAGSATATTPRAGDDVSTTPTTPRVAPAIGTAPAPAR